MNITETSLQLPEPNPSWNLTEFTTNEDLDSLRITSPDGFVLELVTKKNILKFLVLLSKRDIEFTTPDSTRFHIDSFGNVTIVDTDVWVNPQTKPGDVLGQSDELAFMIGSYLASYL